MESKRKMVKVGNDEIRDDLFMKIIDVGIKTYRIGLVREIVKKDFQCFSCKGWPRPGMGNFKKCLSCKKLFCFAGKSTIVDSSQNCGYHLCNGNFRSPTVDVPMTFSVEHLPFVCKNSQLGCEEILDEVNLLEHEIVCNYQKVNCVFMENCKIDVGFFNYLDHFKEAHPFCLTFGTTGNLKLPIDLIQARRTKINL
jgi:hypothetical protein